MEIQGAESGSVSEVVWDDTADTIAVPDLVGLLDRLSRTRTEEEILFRECELDCAFRLAEADAAIAKQAATAESDLLAQVLERVVAAHDLVGASRLTDAAAALGQAIELKVEAEAMVLGPSQPGGG